VADTKELLSYELALRIVAMRNVLADDPPNDYTLRHIYRWYSKTFNTPLHVVDTLPRHFILLHYFESNYETLRDDHQLEQQLNEQIQELINPKDQSTEEIAKVQDFLFEKKLAEENAKVKKEPPKPKPIIQPIDLDNDGEINLQFDDLGKLEDALDPVSKSLVGLK